MIRSTAVLFLVSAAATGAGAVEGPPGTILGTPPLCEASAAVPSPRTPGKFLVADNEVSEALFEFSLVSGRLDSQVAWPLPEASAPSDIEAIAASGDTLWIFGSHSRNKRCEIKTRRQRVLAVRRDPSTGDAVAIKAFDTSRIWRAAVASLDSCLRVLFTDPPPERATDVCRAIVDAERSSRPGSETCETLNIEGAVALPAGTSDDGARLWVGLRAPLSRRSAILLRLATNSDSLRFDGVAFATLGGTGIRELTLREGTIWGIAGPTSDRTPGAFRAFRVDASRLQVGARLEPEWLPGELPPSSEALAFDGDIPIVLLDGDRGSEGARVCLVPSRQVRIEPVASRP